MLHSLLSVGTAPAPELTLIFGARTQEWLYFCGEFEDLSHRHPNFRFWPTLSAAPAEWTGRRGYVQAHLDQALCGRSTGVDVYACGCPAMVEEIRLHLEGSGFDLAALVLEKYE
jgi:NAD(P)H-flavin reductase